MLSGVHFMFGTVYHYQQNQNLRKGPAAYQFVSKTDIQSVLKYVKVRLFAQNRAVKQFISPRLKRFEVRKVHSRRAQIVSS